MSVKGLGSPAGKEPKSESLFINRHSHQEFLPDNSKIEVHDPSIS
jgi:hypothetical protein